MAYAFAVTTVIRHVDGVKFVTHTIVESDVDSSDEFTVDIPTPCTVWLYEAAITDAGASGATTLDPELGTAMAGTDVWVNSTAAGPVREQPDKRVRAMDAGALFGRSKPNQNAVPEITTRITLKHG